MLLTLDRLNDADALLELALSGEPMEASALDRPCQMYRDHGSARPSVTQGHHVYPIYLQNRKYGQIRHGDLRWLCGTCHDNTHAWIYWLMGERKKPNPEPPPRAQELARVVVAWYTDGAA